jgi:predicted negative regulator of RcsB-dependent stress response
MKTTTGPTAYNRSIDDISGDSGIETWIQKNKIAAIGVLVFILIAVLGGGAGYQYLKSQKVKQSEVAYTFTKTALKDFQAKKISAEELLKNLEAIKAKLSVESAGYLSMVVGDELVKQNQEALAGQLWQNTFSTFKGQSYLIYLLGLRLSVQLEDQGKAVEAITVLEKMATSTKVMEAKTNLDLGRLYLQTGNNEKAKKHLQYVVDTFSQDEFAKIAKLYLRKI